jgi:hypothetical protein
MASLSTLRPLSAGPMEAITFLANLSIFIFVKRFSLKDMAAPYQHGLGLIGLRVFIDKVVQSCYWSYGFFPALP